MRVQTQLQDMFFGLADSLATKKRWGFASMCREFPMDADVWTYAVLPSLVKATGKGRSGLPAGNIVYTIPHSAAGESWSKLDQVFRSAFNVDEKVFDPLWRQCCTSRLGDMAIIGEDTMTLSYIRAPIHSLWVRCTDGRARRGFRVGVGVVKVWYTVVLRSALDWNKQIGLKAVGKPP